MARNLQMCERQMVRRFCFLPCLSLSLFLLSLNPHRFSLESQGAENHNEAASLPPSHTLPYLCLFLYSSCSLSFALPPCLLPSIPEPIRSRSVDSRVNGGVLQGCVLEPHLFTVYAWLAASLVRLRIGV